MRVLLKLSFALVLSTGILLGKPGTVEAAATPSYSPMTNCSVLGATRMSSDNTGLLVCALINSLSPVPTACGAAGSVSECRWKAMPGDGGGPTGSLCGLGVSGGAIGTGTVPCAGVDVLTGCPAGYSHVNWMSSVGNMGDPYYIYTCVKN